MITEAQIEVRYPDCDAMGIVHHAVYPVWYEIARMDFFAKIGFSYSDMHKLGINPPMVNLNLQYRSPVCYPGTVRIRTACSISQGKKLELKYAVFFENSKTPCATATSFHIWTGPDMKSLDMRGLPEINHKLSAAENHPAVLILAGGKSSRMGEDKAQVKLHNITLLEHAINFWRNQLPDSQIYVSIGPKDHELSIPDDVVPLSDIVTECGPMGGLHAAFLQTNENLFVVSAVDMPLLTVESFNTLNTNRTGCEDICIYRNDDQPEPLFGFYNRSTLPKIIQLLNDGCYRMSALISQSDATLVKLKNPEALMNTNTKEDLDKAEKLV